MHRSLSILLAAALAACASPGETGETGAPAATAAGPAPAADVTPEEQRMARDAKLNQGRMIAFTECSQCHAVMETGRSPREDAPPLRLVLLNYNTATLEMDLMEGMRVGHADMPRFTFDPRTVDALIVYLESIQAWGRAGAAQPADAG